MPEVRPLIPEFIYNSHLMRSRENITSLSIAVIAWSLWFYLFAPILTIFGWIFGYDRFSVYVWQDPHGTWYSLAIFTLSVSIFSTVFILWAIYNKLRFGKLNRRRQIDCINNEDVASFFSLDVEEIRNAQSAKIIEVYHKENGSIMKIITLSQQEKTTIIHYDGT